jgi:Domain of unknown function (DUF4158)
MARSLDLDELVERWTLLDDERDLVAGKRGATRLGFSLLPKFYTRAGRFPRGRGELPDEAVEFVARQVGVEPGELGLYEWSGRTIAYHRAQIRAHLGFRECSVSDADKLTEWLSANVCVAERRQELARDEFLARCRAERIEPPAPGRVDRVVRSALHPGRAGADRPARGPAAGRGRRPAVGPGHGRGRRTTQLTDADRRGSNHTATAMITSAVMIATAAPFVDTWPPRFAAAVAQTAGRRRDDRSRARCNRRTPSLARKRARRRSA